jgi:5-methylcytosine-specific restriction endonuclease McrA
MELSLRYINGSRTCVECTREAGKRQSKTDYNKAWKKANKEHIKEYNHGYRAENGEVLREKARLKREANLEEFRLKERLWYQHNTEKVKEKCNKYRMANAEKLSLYSRAYKKANPELRRHWEKTRRARKGRFRDIAPTLTEIEARNAEFGNCCAYCGSAEPLQVDHFIPISKDGPHLLTNIVPACHACNSGKRDRDAEDWYRSKHFFREDRWNRILEVLYSSIAAACRAEPV